MPLNFFSTSSRNTNKLLTDWLKILPAGFKFLQNQPEKSKVKTLTKYNQKKMKELQANYSEIMEVKFPRGTIAYRMCNLSPKQMVAQGGFKVEEQLHFASTGSGNNRGSVCFSLLPAITTLFAEENFPKNCKLYLYACLLQGTFFAPGGNWRQIIAPGALPTPAIWFAKEVKAITDDRKVIFGQMIGQVNGVVPNIDKESFEEFLQPVINMPPIEDYGDEDHVMEFKITDTVISKNFQEKVSQHYENRHSPFVFKN